jgi:predicted AAA+ superfamily ATPase
MEFALTERRISIPVGRIQYHHMGPMTFTEYLAALGENKLKESIDSYSFGIDIGPVVHNACQSGTYACNKLRYAPAINTEASLSSSS